MTMEKTTAWKTSDGLMCTALAEAKRLEIAKLIAEVIAILKQKERAKRKVKTPSKKAQKEKVE